MAVKFTWPDYVMYAISLCIPISVGIVVAVRSRFVKQSAESYLMANRSLHWIMVAVSLFATMTAGLSTITIPGEFYYRGNKLMWIYLGYVVAFLITATIIIPKYHRLGFKFISAYEYFEHRFSKPVRVLVGVINLFASGLSNGTTLYLPSIVLAYASDINIYWCIAIGSIVCVVYTVMGGMKAVVYVDNIQALIMFFGIIGLITKASIAVGGWEYAWDIFNKYGRNNILDFDPSPWKRHTAWSVIFMMGFSFTLTDQSTIQRIMSLPNIKRGQLAIGFSLMGNLLLQTFVFVMSIFIFAMYGGNDLMTSDTIQSPVQLFPYFVMEMVGNLPGVPGIVVASMYAGALSSMSSSMTAIGSTFLEDIVRPLHRVVRKEDLSKRACGIIAKLGVLAAGLITVLVGMLIPVFEGSLLTVALSLSSIINGPQLGLLGLAFFVPFAETIGVMVGYAVSTGWAILLYTGAQKWKTGVGIERLPVYMNNFTEVITPAPIEEDPNLFDLSYLWYSFVDAIILMVVASLVSAIVQYRRHKGWHYERPDEQLLYTKSDFLAAIGMLKEDKENQKQADSSVDEQATANGKQQDNNMARDNPAYDNISLENTRL